MDRQMGDELKIERDRKPDKGRHASGSDTED
jgi:hypothetical protein